MKNTLSSVVELKRLRRNEEISKDEYRSGIIDLFSKSLDFEFSEVIGEGTFSTILRVWNENAGRGFAMRIVLNEDLGPKEKEWCKLRHSNILNVLDTQDFPIFDLTWFLSPVVELTLDEAIKGNVFQNEPMAFKLAMSWIKEITSALDYLHKQQLSFMNLKLSNVMICKDQSIKLFGFHRLSKIGRFIFDYDVPYEYLPPESYSADGRKLPIEGIDFDMWCLGVLSIEVLTGKYLSKNMPHELCCWNDDIYPRLFHILKKKNFNKEFHSTFPNSNVKNKMLKVARNFSRACLSFLPESRPSAGMLLHHKLFDDRGMMLKKDKIWKKQLKPMVMKRKIEKTNFLFEIVEPVVQSVASQTSIHDIGEAVTYNDDTNDNDVKGTVSENNINGKMDICERCNEATDIPETTGETKSAMENEITKEIDINIENIDNEKTTEIKTENIKVYKSPNEMSVTDINIESADYEENSLIKVELPVENKLTYETIIPNVHTKNTNNEEITGIEKECAMENEVRNEMSMNDVNFENETDEGTIGIERKSIVENKTTTETNVNDLSTENTINEELMRIEEKSDIKNEVSSEMDTSDVNFENKIGEETIGNEVKSTLENKITTEINVNDINTENIVNEKTTGTEVKSPVEKAFITEINIVNISSDITDNQETPGMFTEAINVYKNQSTSQTNNGDIITENKTISEKNIHDVNTNTAENQETTNAEVEYASKEKLYRKSNIKSSRMNSLGYKIASKVFSFFTK